MMLMMRGRLGVRDRGSGVEWEKNENLLWRGLGLGFGLGDWMMLVRRSSLEREQQHYSPASDEDDDSSPHQTSHPPPSP